MNDNEIIKALERLSAEDPDGFSADVLEMVNCQKAKIEKLEKARQKQGQFLSEERKQKYELYNVIEKAKSDAIKEFAERLKNINSTMDKRIIPTERIDSLVKEMTEVQK